MPRADLEASELAKYGHPCGMCGFAICECPLFRLGDREHPSHPRQVYRRMLAEHFDATARDDLVGYL